MGLMEQIQSLMILRRMVAAVELAGIMPLMDGLEEAVAALGTMGQVVTLIISLPVKDMMEEPLAQVEFLVAVAVVGPEEQEVMVPIQHPEMAAQVLVPTQVFL
jgi:hypothetical protein